MTDARWNFTADEQDLLGLKPGDRLGPGIVGEPVERSNDAVSEIADALVGAEEILEVLSTQGTRGVERECNAARIYDVLTRVRAAKRHLPCCS
jgi:hypothetical protein